MGIPTPQPYGFIHGDFSQKLKAVNNGDIMKSRNQKVTTSNYVSTINIPARDPIQCALRNQRKNRHIRNRSVDIH